MIDFAPVLEAKFFSLPKFVLPFVDYKISFGALLTIAPIALVTLCEHIGDHKSLSNIIGKNIQSDNKSQAPSILAGVQELREKKLNKSNINSLTKRLISSIDKQREEARRRPSPVTDINEQQALKELQKAIDKHNKTVIKKISKITHLSDTKQNFLFGNSVRVGSKKSYQYRN